MKENDIEERVQRELLSHTEDDVLLEAYKLKDKFPHIWNYPSRKSLNSSLKQIIDDLSGQIVLDYGCGRGEESLKYLHSNVKMVFGIDISPVYIDYAFNEANSKGFSSDRFQFKAMDAHKLEFEDNKFDLVIGNGILHHLDYEIAMDEIYRVLKPNGRVVLLEPLADNPLLKVFRMITPKARTIDEAPFSGLQIKQITGKNNWKTEMKYCGVLEAPTAMLTSIILRAYPNNYLLKFVNVFENLMHRFNILNSWNQYILINMIKI